MSNKEIVEFIISNGPTGILTFLVLKVVSIICAWLIRVEPASLIRGLFNRNIRRLEKFLASGYVLGITRKRALLELNQLDNINLTGLTEPRLANAAVQLTLCYGLRSKYLKPWRSWLSEHEGRIEFDRRKYQIASFFVFWINLPCSTIFLALLTYFTTINAGLKMLPLIILSNVIFLWFPWVALWRIPPPSLTKKMHSYLQQFNER